MKLSQPAFADVGGVKKGSQILYEKGKAPSADYLERIACAGADVLFILTGRRERPPEQIIAALDEPRLERAIEIVEGGLADARREAAPAIKAGMISAAYEMLKEPSEATEGRILRLVKG